MREVSHDISMEVDRLIAEIERVRRKQLEVMVAQLDASQHHYRSVAVPYPSATALDIVPTPMLAAADKEIAFLRGKIAFGESLFRRSQELPPLDGNIGSAFMQSISHRTAKPHHRAPPRRIVTTTTTQPAPGGSLSHISSSPLAQAYHTSESKFETHHSHGHELYYSFENTNLFQKKEPPTKRSHSDFFMAQHGLHQKQDWAARESLRESHIATHKPADSQTSTHHNKYLPKSAGVARNEESHCASAATSRSASYVAENLQRRAATTTTPRSVEHRSVSPMSMSDDHQWNANPSPRGHCCALDVDMWQVRQLMNDATCELEEVLQERALFLEESSRLAIEREAEETRSLLETMFFASYPVHRSSKRVCKMVYDAEMRVATLHQDIDDLRVVASDALYDKEVARTEALQASQSMIADVQLSIARERETTFAALEKALLIGSACLLECETSQRLAVQDAEASARLLLDMATFREGAVRLCEGFLRELPAHHPFLKRRAKGGQRYLQLCEEVFERTLTSVNTHFVSKECQTLDGGSGRWLSAAEESRLWGAWYTQNHTYNMLSAMFLVMLEESERSRLVAEEGDRFERELATWTVTLQHYATMRESGSKDAKIAALQLDLAALRGAMNESSPQHSGGMHHSPSIYRVGRPTPLPAVYQGLSPSLQLSPREAAPPLMPGADLEGSPYPPFQMPKSTGEHPAQSNHHQPQEHDTPLALRHVPSARGLTQQTKSFYRAARSVSPNPSEVSSVVSRSASVKNTFTAETHALLSYWPPDRERSASTFSSSLRQPAIPSATRRVFAPIQMPSMEFPSVPVVITMAWALEDLDREAVERKEASMRKQLMATAFQQRIELLQT